MIREFSKLFIYWSENLEATKSMLYLMHS